MWRSMWCRMWCALAAQSGEAVADVQLLRVAGVHGVKDGRSREHNNSTLTAMSNKATHSCFGTFDLQTATLTLHRAFSDAVMSHLRARLVEVVGQQAGVHGCTGEVDFREAKVRGPWVAGLEVGSWELGVVTGMGLWSRGGGLQRG